MNASKLLSLLSIGLMTTLTASTIARADDPAPPATSSDDHAGNKKVRLDFGKGTLRMREKKQLDLSVGGYKNSEGTSGVTIGGTARVPTFLNGKLDTDANRGAYFDPGITGRIDITKDKKLDRAEVDVSVGAVYRHQEIWGSDPQISKKAAKYQAVMDAYAAEAKVYREGHYGRNSDEDTTLGKAIAAKYDAAFKAIGAERPEYCMTNEEYCRGAVQNYIEAMEIYYNCSNYCSSEKNSLDGARAELEKIGISVPQFKKTHLTMDVQALRLTARYKQAKALGYEELSASGDAVQGSLHGAFTINDVNVDICALAAIGGTAGEFSDNDSHLSTVALRAHMKGCLGIGLGKVGNLRGEVGFERVMVPAVSDLKWQKFSAGGALTNIGGLPISIGYDRDDERIQVGNSGGKDVTTHMFNATISR